jgi:ADP-ribose pyrophosphatase
MLKIINQKIIFSSPWFQLVARTQHGSNIPYYVVQAPDCVCVVAVTGAGKVLLVRQHRITINDTTMELPSGHIEKNEQPEKAAYRELLEETGYRADTIEPLGVIATDTGRLSNKLWCYFATNLTYTGQSDDKDILKVHKCNPGTLLKYIKNGKMMHAQDIAAVFLAIQKLKLQI